MTAIYLDHQATSPADPRVVATMVPWMIRPANPHAAHAVGREAAQAVELARCQVADLVGAEPAQVILTSGATEAANIAIRSLPRGSRVLANALEHACVLETLAALAGELDVAFAPVDADGLLDPDQLGAMAAGRDAVIAMAVNNEIGTIQPISDIGAACRMVGASLMTDVVQAVGRIEVDLDAWGATAAWLSSHKIYGPQGVGALIWRGATPPQPLTTGGGQERGLRPGTVPTALAVGFGAACALAQDEAERDALHAATLRDRFLNAMMQTQAGVIVNGSLDHRVPHNLNLAFPGIDADALVASLPGLAISTGSACSAGAIATSHVLAAITSQDIASSSIRVGFGRGTTIADVDAAARQIRDAVDRLMPTMPKRAGGSR